MKKDFFNELDQNLATLKELGFYKPERPLLSSQSSEITIKPDRKVLNFCANNYLGLANHPTLIETAREAALKYGFGMASVRFICGTHDLHRELEQKTAEFLKMEDAIVYPSCFDANGGLFEALFTQEDAILSDSLNHASIIDGIRLSKAQRYRFKNNDMEDLEQKLIAAKDARYRIIATDGVFSMDGIIANLKDICDLAEKYDALVMIDECHATGFLGENGRGTHEYQDVMGKVDIITGTYGKALGGASGGFVAARKEIVQMLKQKSRPYLFSNALAPMIAAASIKALELASNGSDLRHKLHRNSAYFRQKMTDAGFTLTGKDHPIIPVLLKDAKLASDMASELLQEGIYVVGFSYPVVPKGLARIRTQMSANHEIEHIDSAVAAFIKVAERLGVFSDPICH